MSAVKILTLNSSASSRASLDTGTSKARMTANFLAPVVCYFKEQWGGRRRASGQNQSLLGACGAWEQSS